MACRLDIDKSRRPVFQSNEELEEYLNERALEYEVKKAERIKFEEECRIEREKAYQRPPKEFVQDMYSSFSGPKYENDGRKLRRFYVFDYNVKFTIPEGVEEIDMFSFHMCQEVTQIILPQSLTKIGEFAFSGTGIKEICIPEGVEIIESCAFDKCRSLEKVVLPHNLKLISDFAFEHCENLKEINIPDKCIIEWRVFPKHLSKLKDLEMPWEEMRAFEEWRKTNPDILKWHEVREELMEKEYKRIAEEKRKNEIRRQESVRRWNRKHRPSFLKRLIDSVSNLFK